MDSVFDMFENIMEKGENSSSQHLLLFLGCFQKTKSRDYVVKALSNNKILNPF